LLALGFKRQSVPKTTLV